MKSYETKNLLKLSLTAAIVLGVNACNSSTQHVLPPKITCINVDNDPVFDLTSMPVHPFINNNLANKDLAKGKVAYIMCPNDTINIEQDNNSTTPDEVTVVYSTNDGETNPEPCTISGALDSDNSAKFEPFWSKSGAFFTAICTEQ